MIPLAGRVWRHGEGADPHIEADAGVARVLLLLEGMGVWQ